MSWSIYSCENYPKWDEDNNCMTDYRQALGVQVILRAHQWTTLEDFYKHVRYESWIEAAGEGRENIVTGKEVALRMAGDFKLRGIRAADLDKISAEAKKVLEEDGEAQNLKFRRMFVNRFEEQFRGKAQGAPGRWTPNTYELECYTILGMKPPDVVQRIPEQQAQAPVVIQQSVDPVMLQQLVAQELAKQAEAGKKPRTI